MGILWKSNGIIIWNFEDQVQSNPMRMLSKSNGYQWDFSDQIPSNPMRILSKSNGEPWDLSDQIQSNQIKSNENLIKI